MPDPRRLPACASQRAFARLPCRPTAGNHDRQALRRIKPQVVYLPHAGEGDREHQMVGDLGMQAVWMAQEPFFPEAGLPQSPPPNLVLGYEVWTPMSQFQHVVDISDVIETKVTAMRAYASPRHASATTRARSAAWPPTAGGRRSAPGIQKCSPCCTWAASSIGWGCIDGARRRTIDRASARHRLRWPAGQRVGAGTRVDDPGCAGDATTGRLRPTRRMCRRRAMAVVPADPGVPPRCLGRRSTRQHVVRRRGVLRER